MIRFASATAALLIATTAFAIDVANPDPKVVQGGTFAVEPGHTRVQFSVSHLGLTDWYGDFTGVSGSLVLDPAKLAASKVDITIPVASVSTTNAKLDEELRSATWLDATGFPTIRFVSTKIVQTAPNKAAITGDLTFHGVTRPVVLDAVFNGGGENPMSKVYTIGFSATTAIKRSDFGAKMYVPLIGDETSIRISAAFERTK
jgi:polyisoprenoid-binding protein YceI